jgi:hypothetical protein
MSYNNQLFWNRSAFNADPNQAFYLNADPDPDTDPKSQTNEVPSESGSWSQKVEFLLEKYIQSTECR